MWECNFPAAGLKGGWQFKLRPKIGKNARQGGAILVRLSTTARRRVTRDGAVFALHESLASQYGVERLVNRCGKSSPLHERGRENTSHRERFAKTADEKRS